MAARKPSLPHAFATDDEEPPSHIHGQHSQGQRGHIDCNDGVHTKVQQRQRRRLTAPEDKFAEIGIEGQQYTALLARKCQHAMVGDAWVHVTQAHHVVPAATSAPTALAGKFSSSSSRLTLIQPSLAVSAERRLHP